MNRRKGFGVLLVSVLLAAVLLAGGLGWLLGPGQNMPWQSLLPALFHRDATWQAMQVRSAWRVGMDPSFPPFQMLDASGVPVGYDVDLARKLSASWGMEVEIVAIGFDSLLDALQAAKVDAIVSAYPYDPRLTRDVAFSEPYFDAGLQLAVPAGSSIQGRADLDGKRVAVEWGSEGDMVGRQWQREGLALALAPFETPQDAVAALVGAQVDALLVDAVTLGQAQAAGAPIMAAGPHVTSNPYVIVVGRRAYDLLQHVNAGLERLSTTGELARMERTWFQPP